MSVSPPCWYTTYCAFVRTVLCAISIVRAAPVSVHIPALLGVVIWQCLCVWGKRAQGQFGHSVGWQWSEQRQRHCHCAVCPTAFTSVASSSISLSSGSYVSIAACHSLLGRGSANTVCNNSNRQLQASIRTHVLRAADIGSE